MTATSIDALVVVDKPAGVTSFDVVRAVKRALHTKKAGHTGTLDPFATGVLVVLTGKGTRLMRYVPGEPKVYRAKIRFGEERDTDDATGAVTRRAHPPSPALIELALPRLTGTILQRPPAYSAKKIEGRRAYALARAGQVLDLQPVPVCVDRWEILGLTSDEIDARITCGGGTYIRALARDLGVATESAAHLASLRRERSGPFTTAEATSWDALVGAAFTPLPLLAAIPNLPRQDVSPNETALIAHGHAISAAIHGQHAALLGAGQSLLAIARREGDRWQPDVVLADA